MKDLFGIVVLFLLVNTASAGDKGGNGGGGYVCTGPDKKITRVYSYDLWSGEMDGVTVGKKKVYLSMPVSNEEAYLQARNAIGRIKDYHPESYEIFSQVLESIIMRVDAELSRPVTALVTQDDFIPVRSPYQKTFCPRSTSEETVPFKTIITYEDSLSGRNIEERKRNSVGSLYDGLRYTISSSLDGDFLSLDQKLYLSMDSNSHRAALLVHEAVYKILRANLLHTDSKQATELTALLLSTASNEVLYKKMDELYLMGSDDRIYFEPLYRKLLTAQTLSEIEAIMGNHIVRRGQKIEFKGYMEYRVCSDFDLNRVMYPVKYLKDPSPGKCALLTAFLLENDLLFHYFDVLYRPGRGFLFQKSEGDYHEERKDGWMGTVDILQRAKSYGDVYQNRLLLSGNHIELSDAYYTSTAKAWSNKIKRLKKKASAENL